MRVGMKLTRVNSSGAVVVDVAVVVAVPSVGAL